MALDLDTTMARELCLQLRPDALDQIANWAEIAAACAEAEAGRRFKIRDSIALLVDARQLREFAADCRKLAVLARA